MIRSIVADYTFSRIQGSTINKFSGMSSLPTPLQCEYDESIFSNIASSSLQVLDLFEKGFM